MGKHTVKNRIPQQTAWDEPGNSDSISISILFCVLTNPLPCLFSPCLLLGAGFSSPGLGLGSGRVGTLEMFPSRRKWLCDLCGS